ncbi:opacity protein-like surface antigen [Erwinia toletana]|uniref:Opacity protein-like surface antigen n=1 Tax=Winslowiella toletana TaxID=92490 RepID=A0ABS4P9T9_9GAMM|nr:YfaZ family outer membrane protein [Winslowiella toletana]MBP2169377.1 opacity protein-like surface antigen [Winslowiella toletana]
MNKIILSSGVAMLLLAGSAQAIEGGVDVGEHYTNLNVGLGTTTPGLSLSGNWMRSDHDGSVSGVGLGYNIEVGSVFLSPGVKAMFISPQDAKDGYAVAVGGGVQLPVTKMLGVYGEYYYSPDSFSSRIDSYQEASAGLSFTPISLLNLRVGYKYLALDGKDGRKDNVLADGPYIGGSVRF